MFIIFVSNIKILHIEYDKLSLFFFLQFQTEPPPPFLLQMAGYDLASDYEKYEI